MNKQPLKFLFEAMYHGKYDFHDFLTCDIRKDFDEFKIDDRQIFNPNKKLKVYHNFLNLFLLEKLRTNTDVVFSYRKGVNVYQAVSKHAANKYFFQTDLLRFFPSIDVSLVRSTIIGSSDCTPIADILDHVERILELVTVNESLPVGFSTSPLISNACLFEFDNAFQKFCEEREFAYTRYSDDLIVSSKNKGDLVSIEEVLQTLLAEFFNGKIALNQGKTKFTHTGRKIKLLGMVILPNGKVTVDMSFKKHLEVLIHFYLKDRAKFLIMVDSDLKGGMEKLSGYLSYVNTVDNDYLNKLRMKYGATAVDMFLHYTPQK